MVLKLLGVKIADRPVFLGRLLPELSRLHTGTGRPHWSVVDEAHRLLPDAHFEGTAGVPQNMRDCIMVTMHSEQVVLDALP